MNWIKKIILICLIVIFFMVWSLYPGPVKISSLDKILRPRTLLIDGDRAYITERECIHIVSLVTGEILKTFGKRGEGPGEFKSTPLIRMYERGLVADSWGKVLFFDRDGNYQSEFRHQFTHETGIIPLNGTYAAQKSDFPEKEQKASQEFGIYDASFKLIRKIWNAPSPGDIFILSGSGKQPFPMIRDRIYMDAIDGKIYISDSRKGFYFRIFDEHGYPAGDIFVRLEPVKVNAEYKARMLEQLTRESWWGKLKDKLDPVFPEFFPEIRFFTLSGRQIFVETYIDNGDRRLFRIYNVDTKKMSEAYLPAASDLTVKRYDFHKGYYYFLRENEDDETWELYRDKVPDNS